MVNDSLEEAVAEAVAAIGRFLENHGEEGGEYCGE